MRYVFFAVLGYLAGSIPFAYIAGKLKGIDLTKTGSGNLGTSNVFHQVGKVPGVAVFFADCAKIGILLLLMRLTGAGMWEESLAATGVIAGHNWSVFTRFKGGRGMTVTLIASGILMPWETLFILGILGYGFFTKALALFCGVSLLTWPVLAIIHGQHFSRVFFALSALMLGVARRLQGSPELDKRPALISTKELIISRLLYDREPHARV